MNIRKFECKDGQMTITKDGEFFHKNDILLKLLDEQKQIETAFYIKHYDQVNEENMSEWDKKYKFGLKEKLDLIKYLINEFK